MRIHILACRVFQRELSHYAAKSPHVVDITWMPQGLHENPGKLRESLKGELDRLHEQWGSEGLLHRPDFIVLGYGLCSNGVVGIESRDIPMVVPRTDDCLAQLMGSQSAYLQAFAQYPGTYWLSGGWVEQGHVPTKAGEEAQYAAYVQEYGEDNAEYLMEVETAWKKEYARCCYIASPLCESRECLCVTEALSRENGWDHQTFTGNLRMVEALAYGLWNEEEYLICPPSHRVEATGGPDKLRAVPASKEEQ